MHLVKNPRTVQLDHKTRKNLLESHDMWLFLHKFKREASHEFWFKTFGELRDDDVQWSINSLRSGKYTIRGGKWPFLVLSDLRGTRPYNPGRVLRQFEIKQEAPQIDSMLRFFTEYDESESPLKDGMINGWRRRRWTEVTFRIERDLKPATLTKSG